MKNSLWLLAGILISGYMAAGPAAGAELFMFGGGPAGGGWGAAVPVGVQLLNRELKGKYTFQNVPTTNSLTNVRNVANGQFATSWADIPTVFNAWNGTGAFKDDGQIRDMRVIANVRRHIQIFVVLEGSPVQTISGLKGKVVNMVTRGTSANAICTNTLTALGLIDKIQPRYLAFAAAARALGDRQIDVYCSSGGPSIPAVMELSAQKPVRYLSMTEGEQKKVHTRAEYYHPFTTPPYKIHGMEKPFKTVAYNALWIVGKKMSDDAVYQMLKVIAEPKNLENLSKAVRYWSDLNGDLSMLKPLKIPVHPAAAKYWRERKFNVPDEIVKGF